jgi:hypothetical protein
MDGFDRLAVDEDDGDRLCNIKGKRERESTVDRGVGKIADETARSVFSSPCRSRAMDQDPDVH